MDFREEDFPVYRLLMNLGRPGVETARADFERAQVGGDDDKYLFAFCIQTVAVLPPGALPGLTKEMCDKTLQSCLTIFEDIASRGHMGAQFMVEYFKISGLGLPSAPPTPPRQPNRFRPKPGSFEL